LFRRITVARLADRARKHSHRGQRYGCGGAGHAALTRRAHTTLASRLATEQGLEGALIRRRLKRALIIPKRLALDDLTTRDARFGRDRLIRQGPRRALRGSWERPLGPARARRRRRRHLRTILTQRLLGHRSWDRKLSRPFFA
jgi:hypothetical protein